MKKDLKIHQSSEIIFLKGFWIESGVACLVDSIVVVIPVQEDVEAEREGKDEQGIPTAKRRGSIHRQTSTTCG